MVEERGNEGWRKEGIMMLRSECWCDSNTPVSGEHTCERCVGNTGCNTSGPREVRGAAGTNSRGNKENKVPVPRRPVKSESVVGAQRSRVDINTCGPGRAIQAKLYLIWVFQSFPLGNIWLYNRTGLSGEVVRERRRSLAAPQERRANNASSSLMASPCHQRQEDNGKRRASEAFQSVLEVWVASRAAKQGPSGGCWSGAKIHQDWDFLDSPSVNTLDFSM